MVLYLISLDVEYDYRKDKFPPGFYLVILALALLIFDIEYTLYFLSFIGIIVFEFCLGGIFFSLNFDYSCNC